MGCWNPPLFPLLPSVYLCTIRAALQFQVSWINFHFPYKAYCIYTVTDQAHYTDTLTEPSLLHRYINRKELTA